MDGLPAELDGAEDVGFEVVDEERFERIDAAERGERGSGKSSGSGFIALTWCE